MIEASCSALSRDVPLLGTASTQSAYVVVDCPKPWASKIQGSTGFPARPAVEAALARGLSFGLLGRSCEGPSRLLTVYRYNDGAPRQTELALDQRGLPELLIEALEGDGGDAVEPSLLVCTHGSRDRCCGTLGVPLLLALREISSVRAVEVSHLGGHRFAPTCLALPSWRTYGRIPPARGADLAEAIASRDLGQLEYLRGHNALGPVAQLLEAAWALEEGELAEASLPGGDANSVRCLFGGVWAERRGTVKRSPWTGPASCADLGKAGRTEELLRFDAWAS